MKIKGKTWKYGSNINTDEIIPARYLNTTDHNELAKHCLEDLDINFVKKMQEGDILVAENNFGCGSSREHAPISIKATGISCVIAKSFARIFYRNSINMGLPILECPEAVDNSNQGDELEINLECGTIKNNTQKKEFQAKPFPPFMQQLISEGGLMKYVEKKYK
ncbi:MAG: 3-isopropylmalate dehydratase small subunit [bacterium]